MRSTGRGTPAAAGWRPGAPEHVSGPDLVARVLVAAGRLRAEEVARAFVAGVGGSALRGRQVLISYAWARHLPADAEPAACGLPPVAELDVTHELVRLACGWAWNELPARYLVDLEAAAAQGLPEPSDEDWAVFDRVLDLAGDQPDDQTPGGLEKEIARARLLPRTDKYQRYGVLSALAEAGVLPNPLLSPTWDRFVPTSERHAASRLVPGGPRSDIVLPLGAWRGKHGVDRERAATLFHR